MKMIVIGGSAGSLDPIVTILRALPLDLDAAVLVLRHSKPVDGRGPNGLLTQVLAPHCAMPICEAMDGMPALPGQIYVAPAGTNVLLTRQSQRDHHDSGAMAQFELHMAESSRHGRPNIDLALASAADVFGIDAIGVVLSGFLDDGTEGALELAFEHGTMIVQAPADAEQTSMPNNVIARDHPDYILPDIAIGPTLVSLVNGIPAADAVALRAGAGRSG